MLDKLLDWVEANYLKATAILLLVLVLVLSLALAQVARAATVDGTFTLPTKYVDGSNLAAASIKHIRVQVGTCSGTAFGAVEGTQLVVPPATAFSVVVPRPFGEFCVQAQTETTLGTLSDFTGPARVTKSEPKPNPPTLVTVSIVAYELRQYANGTLRFVQVGTVPLQAPCGTFLAGDYAAFSGATITKPTTGGVIAAKCRVQS